MTCQLSQRKVYQIWPSAMRAGHQQIPLRSIRSKGTRISFEITVLARKTSTTLASRKRLNMFQRRIYHGLRELPRPRTEAYSRSLTPFVKPSPQARLSTSSSNPALSQPKRPNPLQNQEIPIARFSELGASRTVKVVVIIALTIGGTLETIFWSKVLWRKFVGGGEEEK